jgi:1-acyl-sn-glycerol-3-phosphate acyltransferase
MTWMYRIVRAILVPLLRLGWRWRFVDLHKIPASGPVIIAANHISYFDPFGHVLCVNAAGRIQRVFAKAELFKNPITGFILRKARMIPVKRGSGEMGPVEAARTALNDGDVIVLYPEATLSSRPDLLPMQGKTGVARLALSTGIPVIPVAIWGSQWVIPPGSRRLKGFRKLVMLKVGDPMRFDELIGRQDDPDTRRDVTDRVMKELERLVVDLQGLHPMGAQVPTRS